MRRSPRVLPPVYLFLAIVAMSGLHWFAPLRQLVHRPLSLLGLIPLALGVGIAAAGARLFVRSGTTIKPFEESSSLVSNGPFRYSRNPMYVGMVLVLLGVGLTLGSLAPFIVVPASVAVIRFRFIRAEEAMLAAKFGDEYAAYQHEVRRLL